MKNFGFLFILFFAFFGMAQDAFCEGGGKAFITPRGTCPHPECGLVFSTSSLRTHHRMNHTSGECCALCPSNEYHFGYFALPTQTVLVARPLQPRIPLTVKIPAPVMRQRPTIQPPPVQAPPSHDFDPNCAQCNPQPLQVIPPLPIEITQWNHPFVSPFLLSGANESSSNRWTEELKTPVEPIEIEKDSKKSPKDEETL